MPVSTLKAYLKAYGLASPANVLEKEEIVDAALNPRVCTEATASIQETHSELVPNRNPMVASQRPTR